MTTPTLADVTHAVVEAAREAPRSDDSPAAIAILEDAVKLYDAAYEVSE